MKQQKVQFQKIAAKKGTQRIDTTSDTCILRHHTGGSDDTTAGRISAWLVGFTLTMVDERGENGRGSVDSTLTTGEDKEGLREDAIVDSISMPGKEGPMRGDDSMMAGGGSGAR